MEPIEALLNIADGAADPDTLKWFRERITAYLTNRNRQSLERILGLERTRFQKDLRDDFLRQAYELTDPAGKPTARVDELAAAIRDFQARIWPRWRDLEEPPATSSELRRLLYFAMKTGEPMPSGWRPLYRTIFGY